MTYEENVRETARQMVLSMYNTIVALPSTISMFDRAARRVVDAKAEGFTDAWNLTNSYLPGSEKELNRLLIERGLIPAPEVNNCEHKTIIGSGLYGVCAACGLPLTLTHNPTGICINSPSNERK